MKYVRVCDISGKGMNDGWCWFDGTFYSKTKEDTIAEIRSDVIKGQLLDDDESKDDILSKSDDELLEWAYDSEMCYYTEWNESDAHEDENGNPQFFNEFG